MTVMNGSRKERRKEQYKKQSKLKLTKLVKEELWYELPSPKRLPK